MTTEKITLTGRPSMEPNIVDHSMTIRWFNGLDVTAEAHISVRDLLDFMTQVANIGSIVVRDAVTDIEMGDCSFCGNRRLVDVKRNGRQTNMYCPRCNPTGRHTPFENVPSIRKPSGE